MDPDGLAFAGVAGQYFRSRDGGTTWQPFEPAPGQRVQEVAFSPADASDGALFAALVSGDFPDLALDAPVDQPAIDHEASLGLQVSYDGGDSWTGRAAGLALDGSPYRHVFDFVLSPTFAVDGTLFAFAWGPRELGPLSPSESARVRQMTGALFRSQDGGLTWEAMRVVPPSSSRHYFHVALSPHFATDGTAVLADSSRWLSPASAGCEVLRSTDGGTSWQQIKARGSYEGCSDVQAFVAAGRVFLSYASNGRWATAPADEWPPPMEPALGDSLISSSSPVVAAPAAETAFLGAPSGGIWALGPPRTATPGRVACPSAPVLGFGRIWNGQPHVQSALGCPLEPERPLRVRVRRYEQPGLGQYADYWPEDNSTMYFRVITPPAGATTWGAIPKEQRPWLVAPDWAASAVLQRFEGGTMLFLVEPDGTRTIQVFGASGSWWQFPDPL
jgi:hypothetical protein